MNYTTIKTKEGEKINFTTQQYEVGTYCIINNDPSQQFGIDENEIKFHKKIQKQAKKNGDVILETSVN
jgi:hypothetical protein